MNQSVTQRLFGVVCRCCSQIAYVFNDQIGVAGRSRYENVITLYVLNFFQREHEHILIFDIINPHDLTQVLKILPQVRLGPTYYT